MPRQLRSKNKSEILFLIVLFLLSLFLRWYKLDQFLFFDFEQGRDAAIVRDIYLHHQLKLVGPQTDIPGLFHGAYYYYLLLVPWILSHGNPLALSFFVVLLSSFVPIVMYLFAKDVFGEKKWAMVIGVLSAVSYDAIIYSRWLSNITPSIPLIILTYYSLWLYQKKKNWKYFLGACMLAAFAAQFEIILVLFFAFAFFVLLISRIIDFPKIKYFLLSLVAAGCVFIPHALFNVRNQNIMVKAILGFLTHHDSSQHTSFLSNVHDFGENMYDIFGKGFSLAHSPLQGIVLFVAVIGLIFAFLQKEQRKKILFFLVWLLMPLPVIIFSGVSHLGQLYVGVSFAMLVLFVFAVQTLFKKLPGKIAIAGLTIILLYGWLLSFQNVQRNKDVFFITIQEGMNYKDQRAALAYINNDAHGQIYRFEAFTIPYFHPEGWDYVQSYFYPNTTDRGSKLVYIAIEKQVDPMWEASWIKDLGKSQLIEEKTFGLLRVQKRVLQ